MNEEVEKKKLSRACLALFQHPMQGKKPFFLAVRSSDFFSTFITGTASRQSHDFSAETCCLIEG